MCKASSQRKIGLVAHTAVPLLNFPMQNYKKIISLPKIIKLFDNEIIIGQLLIAEIYKYYLFINLLSCQRQGIAIITEITTAINIADLSPSKYSISFAFVETLGNIQTSKNAAVLLMK